MLFSIPDSQWTECNSGMTKLGMVTLQFVMAAIAKRLAVCLLATAESLFAVHFGGPFDRRKLCALVAAIAEWLIGGFPAGAPEIAFPGFDSYGKWFLCSDFTFGHDFSLSV